MSEIAATYCDGGVMESNPSWIGGTWAYCQVDASDRLIEITSGIILPSYPDQVITNNQTEYYAALMALDSLPDGWSGEFCSDSTTTLRRMGLYPGVDRMSGLPQEWIKRMHANLLRLGKLTGINCPGHPTKGELDAGRTKDGRRASGWLVLCDSFCTSLHRQFVGRVRPGGLVPVKRPEYTYMPWAN